MSLGGRGLRPYTSGERHRLVGAILELDGHENHFAIAKVFQIVHLEFTFAVTLVPRFAWLIGVFDSCPVMDMLTAASAGHRGPEIIEHVPVEADALTGRKTDDPDTRTFVFRQQRRANARVRVLAL